MRALGAQLRVELVLTLRRGESVLLTIGIPVGLLVFFSLVDVLPTESGLPAGGDAVDFLAPGILALAVMSTAMVSLSIATGFERQYGVLKRLGATPLGRPRLLAAKTGAVLAIEVVQVAVLVPVALALGWAPDAGVATALAGMVLGTIAFAGLGMLMAGTLRAEVTLAAANGLYLALLLLGGMVVPLAELPCALRAAAEVLPAAALADIVSGALVDGSAIPGRAWLVLAGWAVVTPVTAARLFRWE
ncbi:ABC transporter permease [soil metagenome]